MNEQRENKQERQRPNPDCEFCGGSGKLKGHYDPGPPDDCFCMDPDYDEESGGDG